MKQLFKNNITNRKNNIYTVYDVDVRKPLEFTNILIDLYENHEFVVFRWYLLDSEGLLAKHRAKGGKGAYDINHAAEHLSKFPPATLINEDIKVFNNTGLIYHTNILVWLSLYEEKNLKEINNTTNKEISNKLNILKNLGEKISTHLKFCIYADFNDENMVTMKKNWDSRMK